MRFFILYPDVFSIKTAINGLGFPFFFLHYMVKPGRLSIEQKQYSPFAVQLQDHFPYIQQNIVFLFGFLQTRLKIQKIFAGGMDMPGGGRNRPVGHFRGGGRSGGFGGRGRWPGFRGAPPHGGRRPGRAGGFWFHRAPPPPPRYSWRWHRQPYHSGCGCLGCCIPMIFTSLLTAGLIALLAILL